MELMVEAIYNKTINYDGWSITAGYPMLCQIPSYLLQFLDPNLNHSKWISDMDKHLLRQSVFDGLLFGVRC